jgi:hypothetical protein
MKTLIQYAARPFSSIFMCAALLCATGCSTSTPAPTSKPTAEAKPNVMSAADRSAAAQKAAAHPAFKVYLQKIDIPTVIVVAENTTDDQLKNLLWYLRAEIRQDKFKELGMKPTRVLFDEPGYSSGTISIYRGTKCANEMYTTGGPDPCGSSIHKSAAYHWGDGGNRHADGASIITQDGKEVMVFDAEDGWQTDEESQKDPAGSLKKEVNARIKFAQAQTAEQVKKQYDIRFYVDDPDDVLNITSRQFLVPATENSFLSQLQVLDHDDMCSLHFKSINLIARGSTSRLVPLDCSKK